MGLQNEGRNCSHGGNTDEEDIEHMNEAVVMRRESPEDVVGIREVVRAAFGRDGEADLVDALRRAGALTLSAVALSENRVVGHVGFSLITIGESGAGLALAPVAVAPDWQRRGVGSALIRWSLEECRGLGHGMVIVLGEPEYYSRFGFVAAARFGIECPFAVPAEVFMALELSAARAPRGMVKYRQEFEGV